MRGIPCQQTLGLAARLAAAAVAAACLCASAQELSLDDDASGVLSLEERKPGGGGRKKPTKKELLAEQKALAEAKAARLRDLKREGLLDKIAAARTVKERERLQHDYLALLKGEEKLKFARSVLANCPDATDEMRAAMLEIVCDALRIGFGIWGTEWCTRYCTDMPEAELAAREREFYSSLEPLDRLAPKNVRQLHRYAEAMLYRYTRDGGRQDLEKARELYRREAELLADEAKGKDAFRLANALWGEINCIFASGDREGTIAALKRYRDLRLTVRRRKHVRSVSSLVAAAWNYLAKEPLDILRLPFHTDSKAFPEPQEADYTERFAAAPAVRIVAKGLDRKDPRLRLLEVKYARYGIEVRDSAPFAVSVEVDPATKAFDDLGDPAVFAKVKERKRFRPVGKDGKPKAREDKSPDEFRGYMADEGYVLEVTEKGAAITAKTRQGALWGVVSLIQMTDRDRKAVRIAKLRDWPDVEKRGYLGEWWAPTLEYTLFQKFNSVDHQEHPCFENTFEPLTWHLEAEMGRQFHEFGLELFYGMNWITHCPQLPMAYPRTLPYRIEIMKRYAKAHIGVYYPLDDCRFPVEKPDLDRFGTSAAIDGKHQNEIFQAVRKEYPDWRFVVCTPFYWGPDSGAYYPENRETYLRQWRKDVDPEVEVYWTGGRVKSGRFEPYHGEWAKTAYGRRPYLFQNGMGWHNLLDYTIDAQDWPSYYSKGTLDRALKGYHLNATTPDNCAWLTTLADALWNIGGYSPKRAARRGVSQLMGERAYDILDSAYGDLCYFDKYEYGEAGDSVMAEDLDDLERRVANIDRAWKEARDYVRSVGASMYGRYGSGVEYAHSVLNARRRTGNNPAETYKGLLAETASIAKNETCLDTRRKGDTYLSPTALHGGLVLPCYRTPSDSEGRAKDHPRVVTALFGAKAKPERRAASAAFACESFPAGNDYLLCLSMTGGKGTKLRIGVNGKTVFEGAKGLGGDLKFKLFTFRIPVGVLKRKNTLSIENLSDDYDGNGSEDPTYGAVRILRIAYAVVLTSPSIRKDLPEAEDDIIEL